MADEADTKLARAVQSGGELLSKMAGASVGVVAPDLALVGPAVEWISSNLLRRVGRTVVSMVGLRAADRAGAALLVVQADAEGRANRGEAPRDDGFSQPRDGRRPDSEELLEGVLLYAAEAYEERKVPMLGHLYDGLAFDASVSAEQGHFLLKLADRLTYRQLVALSIFADEQMQGPLEHAAWDRDQGRTCLSDAIALEIDDLAESGPLGIRVEGADEISRPGELIGASGRPSATSFQDLQPTPIGRTLYELMRLNTINERDRERLLLELSERRW